MNREKIMIDLTDLNIPDVVVILQQDTISVTSCKEDVMQDVRGLPCPIKTYENGRNTEIIYCEGIDYFALAERLTTTWESRGHIVARVYSPDNAYNRRPVQSFLNVNAASETIEEHTLTLKNAEDECTYTLYQADSMSKIEYIPNT